MNILHATKKYHANEVVVRLGNKQTNKENSGRIQVDEHTFILPPNDIWHSCQPNAYIDWKTMELRALTEIPRGSLVTYHYGTSEDDYRIGAFDCTCGSLECLKRFQGCKFLTKEQREEIKRLLSPYLKKKYF